MSKVDRVKAEIAFHEKMFFAAVAAMIALLGWLASGYKSTQAWLLLFAVFGLFGASLFGVYQYRRIKKLLVELEQC